MNRPQQLAEQFRNGNLSAVAAEVVCDGPTALAVAALLDGEELSRLRRAVDDHIDQTGRSAPGCRRSLVVGGEARGGPVLIPLRGTVS